MLDGRLKQYLIGAIIGCITLSVLMFATGWAVRSDTAEMNAREMSRDAVTEHLAAICVAQFEASGNRAQKLEQLIATESWKRGGFVTAEGWATMPGKTSSESVVADECAVKLVATKG